MASNWTYALWVKVATDHWRFMLGDKVFGMASRADDRTFKWYCDTSNHWAGGAVSIEQAKSDCEALFWKDAWDVVGTSTPSAVARAA